MSLSALILAAAMIVPVGQPCLRPRAIDGDTVACADGTRLRLSGIDAPEMPGHCRAGRACAPGSAIRSRGRLRSGLRLGPLTYRPLLRDIYGRTVALVYAGTINLSCRQLAARQAIYVARWDRGGHVKRECSL